MIPRIDQTPEQRAIFAELRRERDRAKAKKKRDEIRAAKGLTKRVMKSWSAQETELAERLLADGADDDVCMALLGRTRTACFDRVRRMRDKQLGISNAVGHAVDNVYTRVPPEVLDDRNRRLMARMNMDLTGVLCGDPVPGFSALERRT